MEESNTSRAPLTNIAISLIFTLAYGVVLIIYNEISLSMLSNALVILFIVCTLIFSSSAIYFAAISYQKTKIISLILIIINAVGALIPCILLLLLM
jgi:hypothetical protein